MSESSENHTEICALESLLTGAGIRLTDQRLLLAEMLFCKPYWHFTVEDIARITEERGESLAMATIYNNLNLFCKAGLVREVMMSGEQGYFDTNTGNHHHFYDEDEGRLVDIPADDVALLKLPHAPRGKYVSRVDVIIRVSADEALLDKDKMI